MGHFQYLSVPQWAWAPPFFISKLKFPYDKYSVDKVWTKIYCHFYFGGITLAETLLDIGAGLAAQRGNLSSEEREALLFGVKQGKAAIWTWKSHLLHSVNQDSARAENLEKLDKSSVLLAQDWAMKYLPRKYRESQTDWFGKRGIPWHVTVATTTQVVTTAEQP